MARRSRHRILRIELTVSVRQRELRAILRLGDHIAALDNLRHEMIDHIGTKMRAGATVEPGPLYYDQGAAEVRGSVMKSEQKRGEPQ